MNDSTTYFISAQREIFITGQFFNGSSAKDASKRSAVYAFSERSRRRLRSFLRNSVAKYKVFITLTYPPGYGINGDVCKKELKTFLERLKRLQTKRTDRRVGHDGKPWSILWFQEWQKNGRLHFHLCGTHDFPKEWLSLAWYEIVGSGNQDHFKAGTQIKKLVGGRAAMSKYASKYCSKAEQKEVPKDFGWVGRFWGVWGDAFSVAAATSFSQRRAKDPKAKAIIKSLICWLKVLIDEKKIELVVQKGEKNEFNVYKYRDKACDLAIRSQLHMFDMQLTLCGSKYVDEFDPLSPLNMMNEDYMTRNESITDYSELMTEGVFHDFSMYRETQSNEGTEVYSGRSTSNSENSAT